MRKIAGLFGVACLAFTSGQVLAAPVFHSASHNSTPAQTMQTTEVSNTLLRGYEQDGLILHDDVNAGTLTIQADPATLQAHGSNTNNRYRLAMKDVLSAAATYAYLYFGQNPDAQEVTVSANIQTDGFTPASTSSADTAEPAMTLEIGRPAFPISADTKPDSYSAQTIGMILDGIDASKITIAPWLRSALKESN
ncbi:hypothetical protein CSR02_04165 [Acetobacter pomorum]|uniref:Uncharacterized protein n=1 Tax=Acetobacter pomorum TaxID=65959 RepID=A0A2G4RE54_9PROT|nr:hypothetical protein [Acetobacter pomorum]PHY94780.1 hypothetical protein CSR02_04165 [Acetobacter pomorum]